jgi:sugar lactone lactonase YvrE
MAGSTRSDAADRRGEAMQFQQVRRPRFLLGLALSGLLLAVITSSALADAGQSGLSGPSLQEINEASENPGPNEVKIEPTDPEAAEQLPHSDLSRDQAIELLSSVFGPELQGAAGIFDELKVERFDSDHVALIAPGDQPEVEGESDNRPTLLESTLPLRTESADGGKEVVDLSLEHASGELQPSSPLVEVGIPAQLGEGISLPEANLEISLEGAPAERSPSTIEGNVALYPNVAPDSDLTVAPTPEGFETLTQLRSPDAPHTQTFDLNLPTGASLRTTPDGGAEVSRGGEPSVVVPPPTAIDAQGNPVPVDLEASGNSITVTTTPENGNTYPILVDPVYQVYTFGQLGASGEPNFTGWSVFQTNSAFTAATSDWCPACNDIVYGLELNSVPASGIPLNSRVRWDYRIPRWNEAEAPTTYIDHATFGRVGFDVMSQQNNYSIVDDPFFEYYLWDDNLGFISLGRRLGTEGSLTDPNYQYELTNTAHNSNVKRASLELVSTQSHSQYRHLYVGDASIELSDTDYPHFDSLQNPSGWVNSSASAPVPFLARDNGLGVYSLRLTQPSVSTGSKMIETRFGGCTGGAQAPCPRTWSSETGPALKYEPAAMPQGEDVMPLDTVDALGRAGSADPKNPGSPMVKIKVDHTAPGLTLGGSLTEQAALGSNRSQYSLTYNASDGDEATPAALTPFGSAGTSEGKTQGPIGVASDKNGNVWVVDHDNNRVEKFDENGKFLMQFGSTGSGNKEFLKPNGIAISSAGNLWVADGGNHRVMEFSSKGEYLQQFGTGYTQGGPEGGTVFLEPYGVATAPNGMIWVSDFTGQRVGEYRESSTGERFVRNAYGSQSSGNGNPEFAKPAGLATDSQGDLWVVDCEHAKIKKFDPNGKFLMQFGAYGGVGNGQLYAALDIAVAPSGHLLVADSGNNRIQVFKGDGTYLTQFGSAGSGASQFSDPRGITFGAGNTVFVADAANHRISQWNHADKDPQSGVTSTEVKVDGQLVEPKYTPGCSTKNCAISREWMLQSKDYATGSHNVEVLATDGVGLTTKKTLAISTVKDSTAPTVTELSPYFTASKGWMEQKTYSYSTSVTDVGGYGVTSFAFKIDGKTIKSVTQACVSGGCGATLSGSINMAAYQGGAHPAELVAVDAAGNTRRLAATFNVDPSGEVSAAEAAATLDASDQTSETQVVAPTGEVISTEEREDGNDPGLTKEGETLESTGTPNVSTIGVDPADGFTIEAADGELSAQPVSSGASATSAVVVEGVAATSGNASSNVDSVTRPKYNGLTTFQSIRSPLAQETFAWEVQLGEDQSLHQLDAQHVQVMFDEQYVSFIIAAEPAHDALGKSVPTTITVSGPDEIILTVAHKSQSFTYPVVGGAGWEGGYVGNLSAMPPPQPIPGPPSPYPDLPPGEYVKFGPPIPLPDGDTDSEGASASTAAHRAYSMGFEFDQCAWADSTGCWVFDAGLNGRFEYNGNYAWWKESKPHPSCPLDSHGGGMSLVYCNWAGPDHQKYGGGYHISAQVKFTLNGAFGASFTDEEHMTAYLYGDGYGNSHDTAALCNPLSSC